MQAAEGDTRRRTAIRGETELRYQQPRYARGLLWGTRDLSGCDDVSDTARWGLTASPVPGVPLKEFENHEAIQTIKMNPELFRVNCSLNIDRFRDLLVDHPNQALVDSVCRSLREGYWPYADTKFGDIKAGYPTTLDMSSKGSTSNEHLDFIRAQVKVKVAAGRYSASFGPELLPGMYSSPVHAVPKPPDTLRLINHQSYGDHSLNSMISREDVAGTRMDGIRSLGTALLRFREEHGDDVELVIYKSDISHAYRNIWVHPLWQIKQIVSVGTERYVDRCNCFGGRASYLIFLSFSSLLAWIAQEVKLIKNLRTYIDDNGSFARVGDLAYYPPYDSYYPSDQVKLLLLWDELNIPHAKKKQVYGPIIPYVGFDVDPNAMTISLSDDRRSELIAKVRNFSRIGKRHSLLEYQRLAGHINWSLPVWPLLRPCLSGIYAKIAGKTKSFAGIRVNRAVETELEWFVKHASSSSGVFLLRSVAWDPNVASYDLSVCYTDACLTGMAYYYPELALGYQYHIPEEDQGGTILLYEAATVTASVLHKLDCLRPRLAVHTDSHNTVDIWNSLKAPQGYNDLLRAAIDSMLLNHLDVRVLHVQGRENLVADALSRGNNSYALYLVPNLTIHPFKPPRDLLGAAKK